MKYDAFISYSHSADGRLAPALQSGLQRLARPWYRRRALRVFRDETGLAVNPHLWNSIAEAMVESRFFVLLASPDAASSSWVNNEIEHWLSTHSPETLLLVLTDGTLQWDRESGRFDPDASSALPAALAGVYADEPRHLDLRWARNEEQLDVRHPRFRAEIATVAAPIHGMAREDLEGEDVRLHRRALRLAWSAAFVLVLLTLGTAFASVVAVRNADAATRHERERAQAQETADEATLRARRANVLAEAADQDRRRAREGEATAKNGRRQAESLRQKAEVDRQLATRQAEQERVAATRDRISADAARVDAAIARADASALRTESEGLTAANVQAQHELDGALKAAAKAQRDAKTALDTAADALVAASNAVKVAETKTLEAKAVDLALVASDPDRMHHDLQRALLIGREAARLDERSGAHSPAVHDALLALGLESSRGLRRFLQVPDTSGTDIFDPVVATRDGRVAYGSPTTNGITVFDADSSAPYRLDTGGPLLDLAFGLNHDVLVAHVLSAAGDEVLVWQLDVGRSAEVLCADSCELAAEPAGRTFAVARANAGVFVDGNDADVRTPFVGSVGIGGGDGPPGGPAGLSPGGPPLPEPGPSASAFSSDGRWVLGRATEAGDDVVVWDLEHGATRFELDALVAGHVDLVSFDALGTALAVGIDGTSIARIDLDESPVAGARADVGSTVLAVAAGSSGGIAAVASDGRVVHVGASSWEWTPDVPAPLSSVAFSPKAAVLVVGSDLTDSQTMLDATQPTSSSAARVLGRVPRARQTWFSTDESVAFIETADAGSGPASLTVLALGRPANGPIPGVAPAIVQVFDGRYRQFEPSSDASILVGVGDRLDVFRLDSSAWIAADTGLATSAATARTWGSLAGSQRQLGAVAVDGDGSVVAVARDGFGAVWNARDFAPGAGVAAPMPSTASPAVGAPSVTSPDLRFVARSTGAVIEVLDRATGALEHTLFQPGAEIVVGIRFSPAGTYLLSCTGTPQGCERTTVWRMSDGALVSELGAVAVVSDDDHAIAQWDSQAERIEVFTAAGLETHGAPMRTIQLPGFPILGEPALALDGDGSRLAFTDGWSHLVWDTADGRQVANFGTPSSDGGSKVRTTLSANGLVLAVQGTDGATRIWDVGLHPALRGSLPATLHASRLTLNADGSLLATDDPVRLWDTNDLRQTGPTLVDATATTLEFDSRSGTLVVGFGDGPEAAEIFTVDRGRLLDSACRFAGRSLTREEWTQFGIPLPYVAVCR